MLVMSTDDNASRISENGNSRLVSGDGLRLRDIRFGKHDRDALGWSSIVTDVKLKSRRKSGFLFTRENLYNLLYDRFLI